MTDRPATLPIRPNAPAGPDPLSDVLQTVRLTGAVFFLSELTRPCEPARVPRGEALARGLALRSDNVISYHVVTRGSLWAGLYQGQDALVRLDAGDVLVVARGDAYWLGMDPDQPPQPDVERTVGFMNGIASGLLPFVISSGGAGAPQAGIVCGFLACDQSPFNPLIVSLPPLLVIRGVRRIDGAPGDRLDRLIDLTLKEAEENQPGSASVRLRLSELIFVETIRRHLSLIPSEQTGWLRGSRTRSLAARSRSCTRSRRRPGPCRPSPRRPAPRDPCWSSASRS